MREVRLFVNSADARNFVSTVLVPMFNPAPKVLIWGSRVFLHSSDSEYIETFCYAVPILETQLHSVTEICSGPPRRSQVWLQTPAELAIRRAMQAVEMMGADIRLTGAVVLLSQAKDKVSDFFDEQKGETNGTQGTATEAG